MELFHWKCFRKDVCGICQDSDWGMCWISKELQFDLWHGYEIFLLVRLSRLALGLIQLLIQLVPVLFHHLSLDAAVKKAWGCTSFFSNICNHMHKEKSVFSK
jgi:hypothetical protein